MARTRITFRLGRDGRLTPIVVKIGLPTRDHPVLHLTEITLHHNENGAMGAGTGKGQTRFDAVPTGNPGWY